MSNNEKKTKLKFKDTLSPITLLTPNDFCVTVDLSKNDEKTSISIPDSALFEIFQTRGGSYFWAASLFYDQINKQIDKINSTATVKRLDKLKPLFFICREYLFWATVDVDSHSGKLSPNSIKIYSPYEKRVYNKIGKYADGSDKYDIDHPITHSLLSRQIFANNTGDDKTVGYDLIEITISDSDSPKYSFFIPADDLCRWCGKKIDSTRNKTKHNDYCPGTISKNNHILPSVCKSHADSFQRQFTIILNEWKQYRQCISSGKIDKANVIKANSKYAYLLDDTTRFEYIMLVRDFLPLKEIKQLLRPMYNLDTLEPVNFDLDKYTKSKIGPCCPICGNLISENKSIHSKFCSDKCRANSHNDKKKK